MAESGRDCQPASEAACGYVGMERFSAGARLKVAPQAWLPPWDRSALHPPDLSVVITMAVVDVVQVAVHQVVHVAAVRHWLVPAVRAVLVPPGVPATIMLGSTPIRVAVGDVQGMLFDSPVAHVVQMPIMEVINVITVLDASVAAAGTVLVVVAGVHPLSHAHVLVSFFGRLSLGGTVARWGGCQFLRVCQRIANQVGNVPICQCVENVVSLPATGDQPFGVQNA